MLNESFLRVHTFFLFPQLIIVIINLFNAQQGDKKLLGCTLIISLYVMIFKVCRISWAIWFVNNLIYLTFAKACITSGYAIILSILLLKIMSIYASKLLVVK